MMALSELEHLIHGRLPEAEALRLLASLTPDRVDASLLSGLVDLMRETAMTVPAMETAVMDCCGTGGSGLPHYNTSTTVAFVLAAAGVPVVKFGNRAMSSRSGSFDFLEALGFTAECPLDRLPDLLEQTGLVFLYAPQCYPALGTLTRLRRTLGTRTVFNFLGPLLNPVRPAYRLLGVSDTGMQQQMADYLRGRYPDAKAWVVSAGNGLDEIAVHGPTRVLMIERGMLEEQVLNGLDDGHLPQAAHDPAANVAIFQNLIGGVDRDSVYHRMVCLNAGAGLVVAGRTDTLEDGMRWSEDLLANGKVQEQYEATRRAYDALA